jgi:hypothetical protein
MQQQPERLVCSAAHPYQTVGSPRDAQWEHPDAEIVDADKFDIGGAKCRFWVKVHRCPHCGLTFHRSSQK